MKLPQDDSRRARVGRALRALLVLSLLVTTPAAAYTDGLPTPGFDLWTVSAGQPWDLVQSGYSLAEIDPLSGTNMGTTMADALTVEHALHPTLLQTDLLALDTARLAQQARLEALARERRSGSGKLRAGAVPDAYAQLVEDAAASCPGLPVEILAAQLEAESNWNPRAVSRVGAKGLAQFMPGTWAQVGSGDPFNPADAIPAAAKYDCMLLEQTKNVPGDRITNMLAAYNAGPGRVLKYQGVPPISETRNYVKKILARAPELVGDDDSSGGGSGAKVDPSMDGYQNGRLPDSVLCQIGRGGHKLRCDAAEGLKGLDNAYRAAFGTQICLTDTYRSYAAQVDVKRRKPRLAATPGTSNHGWGKAIDFCGGIQTFGTAQHRWMKANAGRYGWVHPRWAQAGGSKPEAWHWEFGKIS